MKSKVVGTNRNNILLLIVLSVVTLSFLLNVLISLSSRRFVCFESPFANAACSGGYFDEQLASTVTLQIGYPRRSNISKTISLESDNLGYYGEEQDKQINIFRDYAKTPEFYENWFIHFLFLMSILYLINKMRHCENSRD